MLSGVSGAALGCLVLALLRPLRSVLPRWLRRVRPSEANGATRMARSSRSVSTQLRSTAHGRAGWAVRVCWSVNYDGVLFAADVESGRIRKPNDLSCPTCHSPLQKIVMPPDIGVRGTSGRPCCTRMVKRFNSADDFQEWERNGWQYFQSEVEHSA